MTRVSQTDRVLIALRKGPVTPQAFFPPTCDGGPGIGRLAARIDDLLDRGCVIENRSPGNRLAEYHLVSEPAVEVERAVSRPTPCGKPSAEADGSLSPDGGLFDSSEYRAPVSHWRHDEAA